MSRINININFDLVRDRIDLDLKGYKRAEWARQVGVSKNVVTNIHGSTKQKPSLEYIVAVSIFTRKPVDYYLWGTKDQEIKVKTPEVIKRAKQILTSGNSNAATMLEMHINQLESIIEAEKERDELKRKVSQLEQERLKDEAEHKEEQSPDEKVA